MTRSEALELIRRAVSRIITVDPKHAVFVNDEEVDYTSKGPIIVRRSALRPLAEERDWVPYLQGSHAWLHANVIGETEGIHIIALKVGPPTASPRRAVDGHPINVNGSVERRALKVIERLIHE